MVPDAARCSARPPAASEQRDLDINQFSDWLSSTGFSQSIQLTSWAIPGIQTVHILALSVLFAAALIVTLRFFGRGFAREPLAAVGARFTRLIWWLLLVQLVTGGLLIVAEPHRTITNPVFYAKVVMLVVVALITAWLAAAARRQHEQVAAVHRAGAALTMLLWIGIIFAGRFIAYYEAI
jgi:hypothetical protein